MNKTKKKWINACNSRILRETMVALGALKEQTSLSELPMNEIQVHLLDEDGDGVVLCIEYDESTGELKKTFHNTEDAYYDEDEDEESLTEEEDAPHYYGEHTHEELDACASPENVKEFLKKRIEETISEEYDEIFHNSGNDDDDDEPPPLLN